MSEKKEPIGIDKMTMIRKTVKRVPVDNPNKETKKD